MVIYHLYCRTPEKNCPIQVVERHLPAVGRSDRGLHWWRSAPCSFSGMLDDVCLFHPRFSHWCWMLDVASLMLDVIILLIFGIWFWTNYIVRSWMKLNYLHVFHGWFIMFLILQYIWCKKISNETPCRQRRWTDIRRRSLVLAPAAPAGTERCWTLPDQRVQWKMQWKMVRNLENKI